MTSLVGFREGLRRKCITLALIYLLAGTDRIWLDGAVFRILVTENV